MITRVRASNYRALRTLDFTPNEKINIIVGDNEAGKSTILEVISLVLGGRLHGRWATDDLNPHWFSKDVVAEFFHRHRNKIACELPAIDLEIFFKADTMAAERLRGLHNSAKEDCPGLRMQIIPDPDQSEEITEYLAQENLPELIPTDLYVVDWRDFSGGKVTRQPLGLGFATVNMTTVSSSSGIDYKLRQLLRDFVTPQESAMIALEHRKAKDSITTGALRSVNDRIDEEGRSFGVGLQMDQSASTNWDMAVTPHIDEIPFSSLGHGKQVTTKIALAMSRNSDRTRFVLVEEPENHLSHTGLMKLLGRINELSAGRQLFITTHSSFVLNRLGFDSLHLMHNAALVPLSDDSISPDTVKYFQKQSGYDTLRLAIAEKIVVVEGPSDEMIFNRAFQSIKGVEPRERGIDVLALGTRGKRALELARALNKNIAVLRDNDGKDPSHWISAADDLIKAGEREMFVGDIGGGNTLEPQLVNSNATDTLRIILDLEENTDVTEYMLKNKTESAWLIVNAEQELNWPTYIQKAVDFIDGN